MGGASSNPNKEFFKKIKGRTEYLWDGGLILNHFATKSDEIANGYIESCRKKIQYTDWKKYIRESDRPYMPFTMQEFLNRWRTYYVNYDNDFPKSDFNKPGFWEQVDSYLYEMSKLYYNYEVKGYVLMYANNHIYTHVRESFEDLILVCQTYEGNLPIFRDAGMSYLDNQNNINEFMKAFSILVGKLKDPQRQEVINKKNKFYEIYGIKTQINKDIIEDKRQEKEITGNAEKPYDIDTKIKEYLISKHTELWNGIWSKFVKTGGANYNEFYNLFDRQNLSYWEKRIKNFGVNAADVDTFIETGNYSEGILVSACKVNSESDLTSIIDSLTKEFFNLDVFTKAKIDKNKFRAAYKTYLETMFKKYGELVVLPRFILEGKAKLYSNSDKLHEFREKWKNVSLDKATNNLAFNYAHNEAVGTFNSILQSMSGGYVGGYVGGCENLTDAVVCAILVFLIIVALLVFVYLVLRSTGVVKPLNLIKLTYL